MDIRSIIVPALAALAAWWYFEQKPKRQGVIGMNRPAKMSDNGVKLLTQWEGLRLQPYKDSAGHWTVGVGHKIDTKREPLLMNGITETEADNLLRADLARFEKVVRDSVAVSVPMTQNEFDAMVSFAFNVGAANFKASTLLKKFNAGDKAAAADQFTRWVYITDPDTKEKVISFGLQNRRNNERSLFLTR